VAGRRSSPDTRGKTTAGGDGVQRLPPAVRWRLATVMRRAGHATPRRRTWIPQAGRAAQRPRGMPTPWERARQTVGRQALAPPGAATWSPPPDGCRPGRSGGEALGASFIAIQAPPQYARKAESHKGVARLAQEAVRAKTPASPVLRRPRHAWRNAGLMDEPPLVPPTAGTPPGGTIAPLVALMALPGLAEARSHLDPQAHGMR
jgi:RNA-directed DNA polymerase